MAGKNAYPVRSVAAPKTLDLSFEFAPNGASTVATIRPKSHITSITRTAAGTWTVTLDAPYYHVMANAQRIGADTDSSFRCAHVSDVVRGYTGNTIFALVHEIGGTATDIVAAATNSVSVFAIAHDSSVGM
jgi:hypothetical protein